MAYTLLVLSLALLSVGQVIQPEQVPLDEAGILYYKTGEIDKNNELLLDYRKASILGKIPFVGYKEYKITKGKLIREGTSNADPSFYLVSKEGFASKKTSVALSDADKLCDVVTDFHLSGRYAQLGYSVYAKDNVDVAPSITYLLANYPKKVTTKALDVNETVLEIPALTCTNYNASLIPYLEFVLHKYGFVGAECIPNSAIPTDVTKCSEAAGNYKKNFENFKEAAFKGNSETVKDVLIRYGAVRLFDGTIIVGWDGADFVTVEELPIPVPDPVPLPERNDGEEPDVPEKPVDLLPYQYVLGTKPISTYISEIQGFVYNNGFTALRAALGLIAAVLVLPALLL